MQTFSNFFVNGLQSSKNYRTFAVSILKYMNTLGESFVFTSFGESHGRAIGGVLDGVPAGLSLDMAAIRCALNRRAGREHSQAIRHGMSPRAMNEVDEVEWLSGVMDGVTLGTPIAFLIRNRDARSEDYEWLMHSFRVGHADHTYQQKYGIRDHRGGGRASARETASRTVAGSIAQQLLAQRGITIHAELIQVGAETQAERFDDTIRRVAEQGDSIGGIVQCCITGIPAGVGDPIFDKLQSHLAFAMMSINACKGFDYGSGFAHIDKTGSEMYLTNNQTLISGGIAGGISDGSPIVFRCVFKPTATNRKTLEAMVQDNKQWVKGRHDACVAVRALPVVEAMAALVVMDRLCANEGQTGQQEDKSE